MQLKLCTYFFFAGHVLTPCWWRRFFNINDDASGGEGPDRVGCSLSSYPDPANLLGDRDKHEHKYLFKERVIPGTFNISKKVRIAPTLGSCSIASGGPEPYHHNDGKRNHTPFWHLNMHLVEVSPESRHYLCNEHSKTVGRFAQMIREPGTVRSLGDL